MNSPSIGACTEYFDNPLMVVVFIDKLKHIALPSGRWIRQLNLQNNVNTQTISHNRHRLSCRLLISKRHVDNHQKWRQPEHTFKRLHIFFKGRDVLSFLFDEVIVIVPNVVFIIDFSKMVIRQNIVHIF